MTVLILAHRQHQIRHSRLPQLWLRLLRTMPSERVLSHLAKRRVQKRRVWAEPGVARRAFHFLRSAACGARGNMLCLFSQTEWCCCAWGIAPSELQLPFNSYLNKSCLCYHGGRRNFPAMIFFSWRAALFHKWLERDGFLCYLHRLLRVGKGFMLFSKWC